MPSPECIAEFCFLCLGHNDRLLFLIARVAGEQMERKHISAVSQYQQCNLAALV